MKNTTMIDETMEYALTRAIVTGGAGFIGNEVVRQLAARGVEVVAVDNLANGKRENLADIPAERARLEVADVRDAERMRALMRGADAVFHLACMGVRHSIHSPRENHAVNAEGTLTLLEAARAEGVRRFVYVSSSEVYGTALWAPMSEEHPTFPMTVYGASKLAGEAYARAYWRTYGFPAVVVRPFNTYGPRSHHEGDSGEAIPKFMLRCLAGRPMVVFGDGRQTRDFTFVEDSARGIIEAGLRAAAIGETLNLGYGEEIAIGELARLVAEAAGRPGAEIVRDSPRPGDVLRLYADMSRARERIGYRPLVSMREGLERLRLWYESLEQTPEQLLEQEIVRNWEKA